LQATLKSFETSSLEQSLKEIEETFQNPNLSIESIRDMQRQQDETISRLKFKLNEQSKVKVNLVKKNQLTPNA
jgi:hypothetical protein